MHPSLSWSLCSFPEAAPKCNRLLALSYLYYRVELRDSRDGVRLSTGDSQNGAQDLCARVWLMHTVETTVRRCVELCARRRERAARALGNETGRLLRLNEVFTLW